MKADKVLLDYFRNPERPVVIKYKTEVELDYLTDVFGLPRAWFCGAGIFFFNIHREPRVIDSMVAFIHKNDTVFTVQDVYNILDEKTVIDISEIFS